jgi:hypothetical protein
MCMKHDKNFIVGVLNAVFGRCALSSQFSLVALLNVIVNGRLSILILSASARWWLGMRQCSHSL